MKRATTGTHHTTAVGGETVRAFVPSPLPPMPRLDLSGQLEVTFDSAGIIREIKDVHGKE